MQLRYRVSFADRPGHRFHVAVRLPEGVSRVRFPSWAPGSYLMREFARFVRDIHAHHEGAEVTVRRESRNGWCVRGPCVLEYDVYGRDKTVRTAFLDESLAFFLPSNLLVYAPGQTGSELEVDLPAGHSAVCPLAPGGGAVATNDGETVTFSAPDLDTLMDSPVAVGPFGVRRFSVLGVEHEHWIEPNHNGDEARIAEDLARIVRAAATLFGGALPYPHYQFVTLHQRAGHGGLEHKNCSVLLRPRLGFADPKGYEELLTLAAHEHFHAWNVKRIHPAELGPSFDYANEHYTRELWWLEGGTVYYEERVAFLAGVVSRERHLERLADHVRRLRGVPGRRHQSLEDSSFDAWIKLYRPNEDASNSTVSYYLKGAVVLMALDLELRHRTDGAVSLDDVLLRLWTEWGARGVGFPPGEIERVVRAFVPADGELVRWFAAHIRGTDEVDVETALDHVGIDVVVPAGRRGGWLGVDLSGLTVASVREDGPSAGVLSPGDEIVAIGGERLEAASLGERLADLPPETRVSVSVAREGRMVDRPVVLGAAPGDLKFVLREGTDARRLRLRAAWLAPMI